MKKPIIYLSLILPLLFYLGVSFVAQTEKAEAMPGFARKYNMSCTTCHAPFPKLKAYGDEFAGNGFVLKDQEAPRYFTKTGDDNLDLIKDLPIGIRLEGFYKYQSETGKNVDFSFPFNLKLLSGGALTKNISYYFYFFFSERGEVAGIEDAFIMFNNLLDRDFDVYLGQFQVSDPLFKRELRLTYEDYNIYKHLVGESQISLSYDRGIMMTYGFPTGTDLVLELLNGNGIGAADENRTYDDDKYKTGAFRLSQDINDNIRIGGVGYYGKEGQAHVNEVIMGGADATLTAGPAELNLQFVERKDSNPEFAEICGPQNKVKSRGGMAELVILPYGDRSRLYMVGLYNAIDYDHGAVAYHTVTGHIGYLLRTNIRGFVENTYDIENEENRFLVGLVTAF
ncbi:MAG: hypothetical protein AB1746_12175 [Candidatus Zixiibacteriota bacterium]